MAEMPQLGPGPVSLQQTLQPYQYMSPDQGKMAREMAKELMYGKGQEQKMTHPMQLFGNIARGLEGHVKEREANTLERQSDLWNKQQMLGGLSGIRPPQNTGGPFMGAHPSPATGTSQSNPWPMPQSGPQPPSPPTMAAPPPPISPGQGTNYTYAPPNKPEVPPPAPGPQSGLGPQTAPQFSDRFGYWQSLLNSNPPGWTA